MATMHTENILGPAPPSAWQRSHERTVLFPAWCNLTYQLRCGPFCWYLSPLTTRYSRHVELKRWRKFSMQKLEPATLHCQNTTPHCNCHVHADAF
jgi:hypothetical protein